jgi:uncharacterized membrane protein YoaK (UPF0700 family)
MLIGLTVVTGIVDAFSYLGMGHVFVANMTGNVVFVAFSLASAPGFSLWASLLAIAAFSSGAILGGRIGVRDSTHRGRLLASAVGVEAVLGLGAFVDAEIVGHPFTGTGKVSLIVLLALTMGVQNATARRLGVPDLTTTVLTLTLTGISADGRLGGGGDSKIGRRLLSVASMFFGALIGALIVRGAHPELGLLVAAALLVVVAFGTASASRTPGAWSEPR